MKFDIAIGNPPYQEITESQSTRMPPIYHLFMDEAFKVAKQVELITPARFLYNAGQTPKKWNYKMLSDPHLKVLMYEPDASKIFANTEIKGGVAVTYYDETSEHEPIGTFVPWSELQSILEKSGPKDIKDSLTDIAESSNVYNLRSIYEDHPDYRKYIADNGRHSQLKTNVLNINPIFTTDRKSDADLKIYGLVDGKRGYKFCSHKYIKDDHKNLKHFKVLVPKAIGSGKFGEAFPPMLIAKPYEGFTQTFISIGDFETEEEAKNLMKFLKTKFCRSLLYVLKTTQDNLPTVWSCIPKQNFKSTSDIDWSKSIPEIDQQLYRKYGLSDEEINFIEEKVQAME